MNRSDLEAALLKPLSDPHGVRHAGLFDPWDDVLNGGIAGCYASASDSLMVEAMEAVRDNKARDFIDRLGFAAEFSLYVLSGHGLTEYGTSPLSAWPENEIEDLWPALIQKWRDYYEAVWGQPFEYIEATGE